MMTSKKALEEYSEHILIDKTITLRRANELFDIIKRDLEVWEILKNKKVDISSLYFYSNSEKALEEYNYWFNDFGFNKPEFKLTEEEFNLIKEWLENDNK